MSRLRELLLKRSIITEGQLANAAGYQKEHGAGLAESLIRLGLVSEPDLTACLVQEYHLPVVDPQSVDPPDEVVQMIPASLARKHALMPIGLNGSILTVAMVDPSNLAAVNEVKFLTGCDVRIALAPIGRIQRAIERFYGKPSVAYAQVLTELKANGPEVLRDEEQIDLSALRRASEDAPLVKLVNALMTDAIEKRASDIHIEPYEQDLRVRFRIDGVLHDIMEPPASLKNGLISRIKIMAALDITERRLPQDGAIKIRLPGVKEVNFRASVLPTVFGEKVVLRLLDKSNLQVDMTQLGFEREALEHVQRAIARPFGMVLVTGPTGSGKSTTLYSALSELNDSSRNISTAEDPVELNIRGINQVQINEEIGLTFAAALRSFLRQDPDVIMVGEIRDGETAQIAVKAALTGHLVLSTLHTNDAPSAVNRLLDMGVEPFLVASSLNLIVAQRLARVICVDCSVAVESYPRETLEEVGFTAEERSLTLLRGTGCRQCAGTGYRGRLGLYEVLPLDDAIRALVLARAPATEIKREAVGAGMRTLRESGLTKVRGGLTTIEEVLRVTSGDS